MGEVAEQVKRRMEAFYEGNPYVRLLEMCLDEVSVGSVMISIKVTGQTHMNAHNITHGGVLMSLADTAMGASCLTVNKKVVTLNMNINCIKAVSEGTKILAYGKLLHNGARTVVGECRITDETGVLYAQAQGTFFVLEKFTE